MNWSDIAKAVGKAAPLAGTLLAGPAGATVGAMVASALGVENAPDAVHAELTSNPEAALKVRQMELEHEKAMRQLALEAETKQLAEVNQTMRAEAASTDKVVRRWRPTFGYLVSISWFVQMSGFVVILGIVAINQPQHLAAVIGALASALTALTALWGIALSVLGVSVSKRSQDKQVAAGQQPDAGLLGALAARIKGR